MAKALEADTLYDQALALRYGPKAYEMRRRPGDQTRPIKALREAMQTATDAWIEAHVAHLRRPTETNETEETVTQ
jgi:hypothetical protein